MTSEAVPPKPVTDIWRPDLTRLPPLHPLRLVFRRFARLLALLLIRLLTRTTFSGFDHLPRQLPALFAVNHLGDADTVVLLAGFPVGPEVLAKVEMWDFPVIGKLMDWYGMIWIHRGRPDRRALRSAEEAFAQGRSVVVAPEGRYSLAQGLELGGHGAAYLAAKTRVPVIPIALTGTENRLVYGSLRHLRRPKIVVTMGEPVELGSGENDREALAENTRRIMQALAALLPPDQRGAYR
ncbi:MAG TPA: lysophospholipid acyltransferase family protein [Anaerolineales bacterium]